ncbi:hypothetical protein HDU76_013927, partial [Blyttiomyces sp. JEL0837]
FYATWCGPCKVISPKFAELSEKYPNIVFLKIDVDDLSEVAESVGIRAMPTFQFYKDGQKIGEIVGADPRKLEEELKKHSA